MGEQQPVREPAADVGRPVRRTLRIRPDQPPCRSTIGTMSAPGHSRTDAMSADAGEVELAADQAREERHVRAELVEYHVGDRADRSIQARDPPAGGAEQPELDVAVLVGLAGGERAVHQGGVQVGVGPADLADPLDQRSCSSKVGRIRVRAAEQHHDPLPGSGRYAPEVSAACAAAVPCSTTIR
jgi:hypothetical protein